MNNKKEIISPPTDPSTHSTPPHPHPKCVFPRPHDPPTPRPHLIPILIYIPPFQILTVSTTTAADPPKIAIFRLTCCNLALIVLDDNFNDFLKIAIFRLTCCKLPLPALNNYASRPPQNRHISFDLLQFSTNRL